MACDTGLVVPASLRPAGFNNSLYQVLPPLEQTLTPALVLFHLEVVYSTTPPVRMSCFVVLTKYVGVTLYMQVLMKQTGLFQVPNSKLQLTTMV